MVTGFAAGLRATRALRAFRLRLGFFMVGDPAAELAKLT
jgi:hypothetical protein